MELRRFISLALLTAFFALQTTSSPITSQDDENPEQTTVVNAVSTDRERSSNTTNNVSLNGENMNNSGQNTTQLNGDNTDNTNHKNNTDINDKYSVNFTANLNQTNANTGSTSAYNAGNFSQTNANSTTDDARNRSLGADDNSTTTESPPLPHCRYEFSAGMRNNLFSNAQGEILPLLAKRIVFHKDQPHCYVTRDDFESKLDVTSDSEAIVFFLIGCLDVSVTKIELKEDDEEDFASQEDSSSSPYTTFTQNPFSSSAPSTGGSTWTGTSSVDSGYKENSTSTDSERRNFQNETKGVEIDDVGNEGGGEGVNQRGGNRYYPNYISYVQNSHCRMSLRVVEMIANMTDLNVLTMYGNKAWDLAELKATPRLCHALSAVKALSIIGDWSAPEYLHHLEVCKGKLDDVVEMALTNLTLTHLPNFLHTTVPNLRALEVGNNEFTSPVDFPWPGGFAELPRNLSRTFQFNDLYNFKGSFDMQRNLFRRVLILRGNNITRLTGFQFTSDFQFISLRGNGMVEIAEDVFDLVPGIQYICLAQNNLTSLPARLFSKLTALRKLELQGNRIQTLPDVIFHDVRNLHFLNLENNALETLQDGLFSRLEELTELRLQNNSIRNFEHGALSMMMVKLKLLELQHNPLTEFPVIALELRGLEHTNLEYTHIKTLDINDISQKTSLSRLAEALKNPTSATDFNNVEDTPTSQRVISLRYSMLRGVVVYNGTRDTLPIFMLFIKHFTLLTEGSQLACDCNILNVTHTLRQWKEEGKLTGTEACLKGWKCEWPTELSGMPVASLQDEQTYCPLEQNGDEGGSASCPPGCACYVRTKIETVIVDCKDAGLTSLPPYVPANTREMWLQNNNIKEIERLPCLKHLHSLKLTANNVQDLPGDVIGMMSELRELHLDDNWMTSLSSDVASLRHLQSVRLAGNPFRCDCRSLWLKDWLLSHKTEVEDWHTIKCSTDESDGRVLTLLPQEEFVCKVSASLGDLAAPIAVPVTFALLALTLGVVVFVQRRPLKVMLYIHTGLHPFDTDPPDSDALYDVSVICDVTVTAYVLRHVIEALEGVGGEGVEGGRYRVFFYPRDAFLVFTTSENVRHCVRHSKRLAVVLGKGWEQSDVMAGAVREGLARCQKEMVHFMAVVLHNVSPGDIRSKHLKHYVARGRYVSTEDKHFTKKLLYEMPHVRGEGRERERGRGRDPESADKNRDTAAVRKNADLRIDGDFGKKDAGLKNSADLGIHVDQRKNAETLRKNSDLKINGNSNFDQEKDAARRKGINGDERIKGLSLKKNEDSSIDQERKSKGMNVDQGEKGSWWKRALGRKPNASPVTEPVVMYDIVAAAENEQNDLVERNSLAQASNRNSFNTQLSVSDAERQLSVIDTARKQYPISDTAEKQLSVSVLKTESSCETEKQLSASDIGINMKNTDSHSNARNNPAFEGDFQIVENLNTERQLNAVDQSVVERQLDNTEVQSQSHTTPNQDLQNQLHTIQHPDIQNQTQIIENPDFETQQHTNDTISNQDLNTQSHTKQNPVFETQPQRNDTIPNPDIQNQSHAIQNPAYEHQLSVDSQPEEQERGKSVFVWYAAKDLPFTRTHIVEPLERHGHTCILRDRDFPLGAAFQENIVHAAQTCTRGIFVLSTDTPKDEWFTYVFHVTFDRRVQLPDHRVALVTREDLDVTSFVEEIQQVLKTSALLGENDPWFWKRLNHFVNFDGQEIC